MTDYTFYTASTLDGFLADDADSLDWLVTQPIDEDRPHNIKDLMAATGAIVMGHTTYRWVVDHITASGEEWMYPDHPTFVFTHRDVVPVHPSITVVAGSPADHRDVLETAAGDRGVWVVGGGDLAAQFAESGMLDELLVSFAPATVGSGRPLFPRAWDFELLETVRNQAFVVARYRVLGPR